MQAHYVKLRIHLGVEVPSELASRRCALRPRYCCPIRRHTCLIKCRSHKYTHSGMLGDFAYRLSVIIVVADSCSFRSAVRVWFLGTRIRPNDDNRYDYITDVTLAINIHATSSAEVLQYHQADDRYDRV